MKINNKEYTLKQTVRSHILFENKLQRPFNHNLPTDLLFMIYCTLAANNPDTFTMSDEEFFDLIDDDSENKIMDQYVKFLNDETKKNNSLNQKKTKKQLNEIDDEDDVKKKI